MKMVLISTLFVLSYINYYLQLDGNLPGILQTIDGLKIPGIFYPQRCPLYWKKWEPFTKHLGNINYLCNQHPVLVSVYVLLCQKLLQCSYKYQGLPFWCWSFTSLLKFRLPVAYSLPTLELSIKSLLRSKSSFCHSKIFNAFSQVPSLHSYPHKVKVQAWCFIFTQGISHRVVSPHAGKFYPSANLYCGASASGCWGRGTCTLSCFRKQSVHHSKQRQQAPRLCLLGAL